MPHGRLFSAAFGHNMHLRLGWPGTVSANGGSHSIAATSRTSTERQNTLVFNCTAGATAYDYMWRLIEFERHGDAKNTRTRSAANVVWKFRYYLASHGSVNGDKIVLLLGADGATSTTNITLALRIANVGGTLYLEASNNGTGAATYPRSRALPASGYVDVIFRHQNNATNCWWLQTKFEGETSWTTEFSGAKHTYDQYTTGNSRRPISAWSLGKLGQACTAKIEYDWVVVQADYATSYATVDTIKNYDAEEWLACGIADVTYEAAKVRYAHWADMRPNDDYVRVAYSTSSDLSSPSYTDWTDTSTGASNQFIVPLDLTGLTADTQYYYRFELSSDGTNQDGPVSSIRKFHTYPTPGTGTRGIEHHWACYGQTYGGAYPNDAFDQLLDYAEANNLPLYRSVNVGDFYYESTWGSTEGGYTTPPETNAGYIGYFLNTLNQAEVARIVRSTALHWFPDDHDVHDSGTNPPVDSRRKTGGSNSLLLAKDYTNGTGYGATTTFADLWDAYQSVYQPWNAELRLWTSGGTGKDYGYYLEGTKCHIYLDDRWEAKVVEYDRSGVGIGSTQAAWLLGVIDTYKNDSRIASFAISTRGVVNRPGSGILTGSCEEWWWIAPDEQKDLIDGIESRLSGTGKKVVWIYGDRHNLFQANRMFEGQSGYYGTDADANQACIPCGCTASVFFEPIIQVSNSETDLCDYFNVTTSPYMLAYYDYRTAADGGTVSDRDSFAFGDEQGNPRQGKASGLGLEWDFANRTISTHVWTDDRRRDFGGWNGRKLLADSSSYSTDGHAEALEALSVGPARRRQPRWFPGLRTRHR